VYIARPPLFRVDAPARGKKPAQKIYALDESELIAIEDKLRKDGVRDGACQISRFKGLGEMSAEQLWDTTLNPDTRRLLPMSLGEMSESDTIKTMDMLMGKSESGARRDWLEERGNEVEADI
jgi:topoisomerase-4 subunit B